MSPQGATPRKVRSYPDQIVLALDLDDAEAAVAALDSALSITFVGPRAQWDGAERVRSFLALEIAKAKRVAEQAGRT